MVSSMSSRVVESHGTIGDVEVGVEFVGLYLVEARPLARKSDVKASQSAWRNGAMNSPHGSRKPKRPSLTTTNEQTVCSGSDKIQEAPFKEAL